MTFFQALDMFDKLESDKDDLIKHVNSGRYLSDMVSFLSALFIIAQVIVAISPQIHRDLLTTPRNLDLNNFVNISLSILVNSPCYFLHLDQFDTIGETHLQINDTIKFRRMHPTQGFIGYANQSNNDECFSCQGLFGKDACCNSCEQLKLYHKFQNMTFDPSKWEQCKGNTTYKAYRKELCHIKGKMSVNRVKGSFHIAPGHNMMNKSSHIHDFFDAVSYTNLSHAVYNVRLGPSIPTAANPLRNFRIIEKSGYHAYRYNLIATPVSFIMDGKMLEKGFEYTALITSSEVKINDGNAPGIYFNYDFTPYSIAITWRSQSLGGFLASTAGFISGLYSIFVLIDNRIEARQSSKEEKEKKPDVWENNEKKNNPQN